MKVSKAAATAAVALSYAADLPAGVSAKRIKVKNIFKAKNEVAGAVDQHEEDLMRDISFLKDTIAMDGEDEEYWDRILQISESVPSTGRRLRRSRVLDADDKSSLNE